MARVVRRGRDRLLGELSRLLEVAEARDAVRERRGDLVLEGLHPVRVAQVMLRVTRALERHVEEMAEVVVVPGVLRGDDQRPSIRRDGCAEVPEERLTQPHQRVHDVVVLSMDGDAPQMQSGLPRIGLDPQLRQVTMREERVLSLVADDVEELEQERGDVVGVGALREGVFSEPAQPVRVVGSSAHARLV